MPPPGICLFLVLILVFFPVSIVTGVHERQSILDRQARAPFNGMRGKRLSGEDFTNEVCNRCEKVLTTRIALRVHGREDLSVGRELHLME